MSVRQDGLPPGGHFRLPQRIQDAHVGESILQSRTKGPSPSDRPAECLPLELILINDRALDDASRQIAMQTPIIDEDAGWPIGRSVERNFDLDPPLHPKDLNPLIRHGLG